MPDILKPIWEFDGALDCSYIVFDEDAGWVYGRKRSTDLRWYTATYNNLIHPSHYCTGENIPDSAYKNNSFFMRKYN
jgi:hypothetical protein